MAGWLDRPRVFRVGEHNRTSREPTDSARKPSGRTLEWHVIATSYGYQLSCENEIAAAGWRVYCPLHLHRTMRNADKIVPLFPNYIFVQFARDSDWGSLRYIRYVWHVLQSQPGRPSVVPDPIIEELQRRTSPRRIVDDPLITPIRYRKGERLIVTRGPLTGLEGICAMSGSGRVHLLFQLLGQDMEQDFHPLDVMPGG